MYAALCTGEATIRKVTCMSVPGSVVKYIYSLSIFVPIFKILLFIPSVFPPCYLFLPPLSLSLSEPHLFSGFLLLSSSVSSYGHDEMIIPTSLASAEFLSGALLIKQR
jgi:hypothetical protein